MKNLNLFIIILLAFLNFNCATLLTGTRDKIYFYTEQAGAKVIINGVTKGITPATIKVKRKIVITKVVFEKEGYESAEIILDKKFNPFYVLNFPFCFVAYIGFVGVGIDVATGAIMKYNRVYYDVELKKK